MSSSQEINASNIIVMHTDKPESPFKYTCIPANLGAENCKVDGGNLNDKAFVFNNFEKVKDCIFHCPFDSNKIRMEPGQVEKKDADGNTMTDDNGNTIFEEGMVKSDYNLSHDFFHIAPKRPGDTVESWGVIPGRSPNEVPLQGQRNSTLNRNNTSSVAVRDNRPMTRTASDNARARTYNLIINTKPFDYTKPDGTITKCYPINLGSDKCVSNNPLNRTSEKVNIINPVGCQAYCNSDFSDKMDKSKGFILENKLSTSML